MKSIAQAKIAIAILEQRQARQYEEGKYRTINEARNGEGPVTDYTPLETTAEQTLIAYLTQEGP